MIKKNSGVSNTRNIGLENSKGKYIVFIDSDDYIDLNFLSKMYSILIENDVDAVRCSNNIVNDTKIIGVEKNPVEIINKVISKMDYILGKGV